jgi:hypothetical protein
LVPARISTDPARARTKSSGSKSVEAARAVPTKTGIIAVVYEKGRRARYQARLRVSGALVIGL